MALSCSCASGRPDRRLNITVDDELHLYLDGKEMTLTHAREWNVSDTVVLPKDTKVIAVKGVNTYADTGIIASTPDGLIRTNAKWKCINKRLTGWEGRDFDDSAWPPASIFKSHVEKPILGIREDAHWIWTDNPSYKDGDRTVYCRYTIPKSQRS